MLDFLFRPTIHKERAKPSEGVLGEVSVRKRTVPSVRYRTANEDLCMKKERSRPDTGNITLSAVDILYFKPPENRLFRADGRVGGEF